MVLLKGKAAAALRLIGRFKCPPLDTFDLLCHSQSAKTPSRWHKDVRQNRFLADMLLWNDIDLPLKSKHPPGSYPAPERATTTRSPAPALPVRPI